ncbi:MAG: hypothetical protein FWC79_02785 [Oscillospiraceae bacterium]|nr:hypothetical protein [Oscillospiraceae bacterium]
MNFRIDNNLTFEDFKEIEEIEKSYFDIDTVVTSSQVYKWHLVNPDTEIVVKSIVNDEVVGQISVIPLSKEQYKNFINGDLKDTEINEDNIITYINHCEYHLLFSCITIKKQYRENKMILYCLLKGLYEKIKYLESKDIKFINMCAEGQTTDGQNFLEKFLSLKLMGKTKDNYSLYYFEKDYNDFDNWFTAFPTYIEKYYNNFSNAY